jgi:membrane protein YqaA with SNARE-associated domain
MATMKVVKLGSTVAGSAALVSTVFAGATIWLLLTDPGTVTGALAEGSAERLLRVLIEVIGSVLGRVLRWM